MIFKTEWGRVSKEIAGIGSVLGTRWALIQYYKQQSFQKVFFFICLNNILRRTQSTFHSPAPLKRSSTKVIQCWFMDFLNNIFVFRNEIPAVGLKNTSNLASAPVILKANGFRWVFRNFHCQDCDEMRWVSPWPLDECPSRWPARRELFMSANQRGGLSDQSISFQCFLHLLWFMDILCKNVLSHYISIITPLCLGHQ